MTEETPPSVGTKRSACLAFFDAAISQGQKFKLHDVTVEDVISDLKRHSLSDVRKKYDGRLNERDIDICRTIATQEMPEGKEYKHPSAKQKSLILFDENTPYHAISRINDDKNHLIHISFRKLTTKPDPTIWKFAKKHHFNAIVTNDMDFVAIAEFEIMRRLAAVGDFRKTGIINLPLVVHIATGNRKSDKAEDLCRVHIDEIARLSRTPGRRVAYVTLSDRGLSAGPTVEEIYRQYMWPLLKNKSSPVSPVFDESVIRKDSINHIATTFGFPHIAFTADPDLRRVFDEACAEKKELKLQRYNIRSSSAPSPGLAA